VSWCWLDACVDCVDALTPSMRDRTSPWFPLCHLVSVSLAHNRMRFLPSILSHAVSLERLDVSFNHIVLLPDVFHSWPRLASFDVSNNMVRGLLTFSLPLVMWIEAQLGVSTADTPPASITWSLHSPAQSVCSMQPTVYAPAFTYRMSQPRPSEHQRQPKSASRPALRGGVSLCLAYTRAATRCTHSYGGRCPARSRA